MKDDVASANDAYGQLKANLFISGFTLERAFRNFLEPLLTGDGWRLCGGGYEDVNAFMDSLRLEKFRAIASERKRIAQRIKELQPVVSNRRIARTLGVGHDTIDRDLGRNGANAPMESENSRETNGTQGGNGADAPSALTGREAAVTVDRKAQKDVAREETKQRREREVAKKAKDVPDVTNRYRLVNGSVTKLMQEPAGTADLIVTDPPYPEEYLPLFGELARVAAHMLKPGGLLICMAGQTYLPRVFAELESAGLQYLWTLSYLTPGGQATQVFPRRVNTFWKPVIVYCQGEYSGEWYGDVTRSDVNDNDKDHHHWGQSVSGTRDLMKRFVTPDQVVVDPFLGGGTTAVVALELGATFIGYDIDKKAIETTRARIADATK